MRASEPVLRLVPTAPNAGLQGLAVFERGWLSSNNVLVHGGGEGAALIDSSHCLHAEQTVALVRGALRDEPLHCVLNTHLHSDHCGGNAALRRAFGARVLVPAASFDAVQRWDEDALSFRATGQRAERFVADGTLTPGDELALGGRSWLVIAAPGHDPRSVILFDAAEGVLISADALWENGFGVVFPELDGESAFDDVEEVLDTISRLPVRWVVPGHGGVFSDVAAALQRARSRLAGFRADPPRHARHGAKVLIKYHLMEEQRQTLAAFDTWVASAPLLARIWVRMGHPQNSVEQWCAQLAGELAQSGALEMRDGVLCNT